GSLGYPSPLHWIWMRRSAAAVAAVPSPARANSANAGCFRQLHAGSSSLACSPRREQYLQKSEWRHFEQNKGEGVRNCRMAKTAGWLNTSSMLCLIRFPNTSSCAPKVGHGLTLPQGSIANVRYPAPHPSSPSTSQTVSSDSTPRKPL